MMTTKWLSEAKLGDQVLVYVDGGDELSYNRTQRTITAIVIGRGREENEDEGDDETFVLGWCIDQDRPWNMSRTSSDDLFPPGYNWIDRAGEYVYRYYATGTACMIASRGIFGAESSRKGISVQSFDKRLVQPVEPTDVSDWRAWRSNRPGECPCGGVRGVCPYHP